MAKKIKAWLQPNALTEDKSDFFAVIDSFGSVTPKDVIKELVTEGMELKVETVLDVITRYNRKCIEMVMSGYNVNTGITYMRPMIKGSFSDKTWNPELHRLYVAITQGTDMRNAVADTKVEIIGERSDPMSLFCVTDLSTGKTATLRRGFNAELKGSCIKLMRENGSYIKLGDSEDMKIGVFFRKVDSITIPANPDDEEDGGKGTPIVDESTGDNKFIDPQYVAVNDPSRVVIIVPNDLLPGVYQIGVVTYYGANNKPLKSPRTAKLSYLVEVC
jgi:hypothetical protein